MKLLLCRKCQDVVKLQYKERKCLCGESSGQYLEDGLNAIFEGDNACLIGFANESLRMSLFMFDNDNQNGRKRSRGERFEAFIIPLNSPSIEKKLLIQEEEKSDNWIDSMFEGE